MTVSIVFENKLRTKHYLCNKKSPVMVIFICLLFEVVSEH